ncbi:MAG: hypothetical protein ACFFAN_08165 [Promethearchaeota archaeon]
MKKKKGLKSNDNCLSFIPVPVYLISTLDEKDIYNIVLYRMIVPVSYNPLIVNIG